MARMPILIGFVWILVVLESDCGSGTNTPPPPPPPPPPPAKVSIVTPGLIDGMVTFPYNQTLRAAGGVAPFVWSVSSSSLPHNLTLGASSANISGTPDIAQVANFTIQVRDAKNQTAMQSYIVNISSTGVAQLQTVSGQAPAGTLEIQGVSAGQFNPLSWQEDTLNWVPDIRIPVLPPLLGPYQNIYSPWPLEQANGWLLFYGGWDGTNTGNDRVYDVPTPDFLNFGIRNLVIDHGAYVHVNNENVTQLADGSMHMMCTGELDPAGLDKPTYFFSPDGVTWNGSPEPYAAQQSDTVSISNDPIYAGFDYNGGNVLLWDNNAWTLYYSSGVYGGSNGKVYRATSTSPPGFQSARSVLNTSHYSNDVRKFQAGGKTWYLMILYVEEAAAPVPNPAFTYALSNDGTSFGPEQPLFGGAYPQDHFVTTPALVIRGSSILGVLYGGNAVDLLDPENAIYGRWLQKKVVLTDTSGTQYSPEGSYGPDRQWFQAQTSSLQGTILVYAEDGVTPLASGTVNLTAGNAYHLVIH